MYKGFFGFTAIATVKWGLTLMIMFLALYVSYFVGYYDAPGFSLESAVALTDLAGSLLGTDLTYYGVEWFSSWGTLGTVIGVAIEICSRICGSDFSIAPDFSTVALHTIITTVITTIYISVTVKLYLKMAQRLNCKCSGGLIGIINSGIDILLVLMIVYLGIICSGCLTRRAMILTAGLSDGVLFIVYIAVLFLVSTLLAVIDSRFNNSVGIFRSFIDISLQMLYSILISVESLCIAAAVLILESVNDISWTNDHMRIFSVMMLFTVALIATIYLANRKQ